LPVEGQGLAERVSEEYFQAFFFLLISLYVFYIRRADKIKAMLIDYHLHNHHSPDSEAQSIELLNKERSLGITDIAFTNHAEWWTKKQGEGGQSRFDLSEALHRFGLIEKEIISLRPQFPDLKLRLGVELEWTDGKMEDKAKFVQQIPFDFVLGSVHMLEGHVILSHKYADAFFKGRPEEKAYPLYFEKLLELLEWGHFDVFAHFDVIKKYGHNYYGPFDPEKYKPIITKILDGAARKGIGLELNTGSLHKRCKELFPHPKILKWALEAGIENFTLSSDAHRVEHAGEHIKEALQIAKDVGVKGISVYEKRIPKINAL
jgi:histidinol-phosphatase (PHP family)